MYKNAKVAFLLLSSKQFICHRCQALRSLSSSSFPSPSRRLSSRSRTLHALSATKDNSSKDDKNEKDSRTPAQHASSSRSNLLDTIIQHEFESSERIPPRLPTDLAKAQRNLQRDNLAEIIYELLSDPRKHSFAKRNGYVAVEDLLSHPDLGDVDIRNLERIARSDPKQRFNMTFKPQSIPGVKDSVFGAAWIRARRADDKPQRKLERIWNLSQIIRDPTVWVREEDWEGFVKHNGIPCPDAESHITLHQNWPPIEISQLPEQGRQAFVYVTIDPLGLLSPAHSRAKNKKSTKIQDEEREGRVEGVKLYLDRKRKEVLVAASGPTGGSSSSSSRPIFTSTQPSPLTQTQTELHQVLLPPSTFTTLTKLSIITQPLPFTPPAPGKEDVWNKKAWAGPGSDGEEVKMLRTVRKGIGRGPWRFWKEEEGGERMRKEREREDEEEDIESKESEIEEGEKELEKEARGLFGARDN